MPRIQVVAVAIVYAVSVGLLLAGMVVLSLAFVLVMLTIYAIGGWR